MICNLTVNLVWFNAKWARRHWIAAEIICEVKSRFQLLTKFNFLLQKGFIQVISLPLTYIIKLSTYTYIKNTCGQRCYLRWIRVAEFVPKFYQDLPFNHKLIVPVGYTELSKGLQLTLCCRLKYWTRTPHICSLYVKINSRN